MRTYQITLTGVTPLLMHADNLEWTAVVEQWQKAPENRDMSIKGDDRSPAWRWIGALYHDGTHVALPAEAIMAALMRAGASITLKGNKTYKSLTQSGMTILTTHLELQAGGAVVPVSKIEPLRHEMDFVKHTTRVRDLGFALDVRRARVGQSKHVRVRPVFDTWTASGVLNVWDEALTDDILAQLFRVAGDQVGILEWRPSAPRPGPFGRFTATVERT